MRKIKGVLQIIKIYKIKDFKIYCAYNNGEYRIIDFNNLFEKWDTKKTDFEYPLKNINDFKKVQIREGALCWPHIKRQLKIANGQKFDTYLDFDSIVLYNNSILDEKANKRYEFGELLKSERKKAGLSQEELAARSGTTKNYISRIENNTSDIKLKTLRKIIEIGLDKNLKIAIG